MFETMLAAERLPRETQRTLLEVMLSLKDETGLEGAVEIVPLGALPDDGKLIVDERALA